MHQIDGGHLKLKDKFIEKLIMYLVKSDIDTTLNLHSQNGSLPKIFAKGSFHNTEFLLLVSSYNAAVSVSEGPKWQISDLLKFCLYVAYIYATQSKIMSHLSTILVFQYKLLDH